MAYAIELAPSAEREFRKLGHEVQRRLRPRLEALASNPRPPGSKKLRAPEDLWRIRVGDYRVVYEIRDRILLILVVRIAHRRDVYR